MRFEEQIKVHDLDPWIDNHNNSLGEFPFHEVKVASHQKRYWVQFQFQILPQSQL